MINARMMYLRPGNMFKEFVVESNRQKVTSTGRVVQDTSGDGSKFLKGCLAEASDQDRQNHSTKEHIVTHTIVQSGPPVAKRSDKLILTDKLQTKSRSFYIVEVDDVGTIGVSTIYYAEERNDV